MPQVIERVKIKSKNNSLVNITVSSDIQVSQKSSNGDTNW